MGLDDLIPDEVDESTSRAPRQSKDDSSDDDIVKSFGEPPKRKKFTEDQWEHVKRVIREEFGMKVGTVVNSPPDQRYELLHEAAMTPASKIGEAESESSSSTRCHYCDKACDDAYVELEGKKFCVHHTVAQAETTLHND